MAGFLGDKAEEMIENIMEKHGIEPGELYKTIDQTLEVINDMAPQIQRMEQISDRLDDDIGEFRDEVKQFNNNAERLADALEENTETLEKFADLVEDIEED